MPMRTFNQSDLQVVDRVSQDLKRLRIGLMELFPEREWLINQLLIALITGQNLIIYGVHGSAKSLLVRTLFNSIVGQGINGEEMETFLIQLDNETTKTDLIGPPNIPLYETTGRMEYAINGYLPTAHLAYIDEMFDGPSVLRGLNDILNERELTEGNQIVKVPLLTAIAATNRNPEQITQMIPWLQLEAFNDRFLFVSRVEYLEESDNQDRMIVNYLTSAQLSTTVHFSDLQRVVEIIRRTNQFPDRDFIRTYRQVICDFGDAVGRKISDRRLNWLTQVVEAQAIMQGRLNLYVDDILAAALGLCESTNDPSYHTFQQVAEPILETAKQARHEHIDEAQKKHLERIEKSVISIRNLVQQGLHGKTSSELGGILRDLSDYKRELEGISPNLDVNDRWRLRLLQEVEDAHKNVANSF